MSDPQVRFQQAVQAMQTGEFARAEEICRDLNSEMPENPSVLNLLGSVLLRRGAFADATSVLGRAADASPEEAGLLANYGNALRQSGRADDAIGVYQRALRVDPMHAIATYNLANVLADSGRDAEAVEAYRKATKVAPTNVGAWFNLGQLLLKGGDFEQAAASYEQALAIDRSSSAAYLALGIAQQKLGRLEDAVANLTKATDLRPRHAPSLQALGALQRQLGRIEEAAESFRRAAAADDRDPGTAAGLALVLSEIGDLAGARRWYEKALQLDDTDAAVWTGYAWTLNELGEPGEAINASDQAIARQPDIANAHYHKALAQFRAGDVSAAIGALRSAIECDPRHVRAYGMLGPLLENSGHVQEAGSMFDHAGLIWTDRLTALPGYRDVPEFNRALADYLRDHPSLMWNRPARSTVAGSQTLDIANDRTPVITALLAQLKGRINAYLDHLRMHGADGFLALPPLHWDLVVWGVVLRSAGHQDPHHHPSGFVSGVYYVNIPDNLDHRAEGVDVPPPGSIEFGESNILDQEGNRLAFNQRYHVVPSPGDLLLFPSYFWHQTIPFESVQERISVAFDVMPRPK